MSNLLEPSSVNSYDFLSLFMIIELAIFVMEFQTFLSSWFGSKEDDDHWLSENLGEREKAAISIPTHGRQHGRRDPQASKHIFSRKKWCSSSWVNQDERMHRVRGARQPEVRWVRQCLLLLRCSPGDQRHRQSPYYWTIPFWRKNIGRHTSLLAHPARLWRARYRPKI